MGGDHRSTGHRDAARSSRHEQRSSDVGNARAFLWIVPARIEGDWKFTEAGDNKSFMVRLRHAFNNWSHRPPPNLDWPCKAGRLRGNQMEIVVRGLQAQQRH